MPGAVVSLGGRPAPAAKENEPTHESGGRSFGVVYVNSLASEVMKAEPPRQVPQGSVIVREKLVQGSDARGDMKAEPSRQFPQGSVIVREKLASGDDAQPQLLTVMIKRGRGFNPKANDWEFLTVDGAMSRVLKRQKKGSCLDCHASQKRHDFVYQTPGQ